MGNVSKAVLAMIAAIALYFVVRKYRAKPAPAALGDGSIARDGSQIDDGSEVLNLSSNDGAARISSLTPGKKMIVIGDSLALGLSRWGLNQWAQASGYGFGAHAVGGTRAADWAPKLAGILDDEIGPHDKALVLVSLGTNDSGPAWAGNDPAVVGAAMKDIAKVVDDHGAELVWIGMPELPVSKLPNQQRIRDLIAQLQPGFIDSTKMRFARTDDQIHAPPSGYSDWAAQIWSELRNRGILA